MSVSRNAPHRRLPAPKDSALEDSARKDSNEGTLSYLGPYFILVLITAWALVLAGVGTA